MSIHGHLDNKEMRPDNFIFHRISTRYMAELNQFCEADKDIENCRRKLEQEVFRHDWFVAWFDREGTPFYKLPLFNKPYFKEALRRFYTKAHDFINRFGFVGYYHVKDIDAWILEVSQPLPAATKKKRRNNQCQEEGEPIELDLNINVGLGGEEYEYEYISEDEEEEVVTEPSAAERERERQVRENISSNFPFGVIPIGLSDNAGYGHYTVVENRNTMQNTIIFEPNDETLSLYYNFTVVDHGARFRSLPYCADSRGSNGTLFGQDLVPISAFEELRRQKRLVMEGETSLFDANSMIIYPESIAYVKPMKDMPIEDVADDTLYSLNNIIQAKQIGNYERQELAMDDARFQLQRNAMKRTMRTNCTPCGSGGYVSTPSTKIWDEKMRNDRPSSYEAMRYLPGPVEILGSKPGAPVVNVAERERKYENDVCTVMRLPYVFFKPHGMMHESASSSKRTGGSLSGSTGHNDMYQKLLEAEVKSQHELFGDIFKEIYYHTFSKLDSQLFVAIATEPSFFDGVEAGLHFEHTLVKSDEAIMGLIKFYEAGIVPVDVIRNLVYKNYNIPLNDMDSPIAEPPTKRRRLGTDILESQ